MKETASVEVTVTATGNDTADRNRTVTVAADLDGTAIGSTDITILDDETTNTDATGQPLITGTARVGGELTATKHTIADMDGLPATFPGDYTFEWMRVDATDTETPVGTDSNSYTVLSADVGNTIRVDVSFTDGAGQFGGSACECGDGGGRGEQRPDVGYPDSGPVGSDRDGVQLYGPGEHVQRRGQRPADLHGRRKTTARRCPRGCPLTTAPAPSRARRPPRS